MTFNEWLELDQAAECPRCETEMMVIQLAEREIFVCQDCALALSFEEWREMWRVENG